MKLTTFATVAALAVSTVAVSSSANADVINFSGANVNMGGVHVGQTGTITNLFSTLFTLPPNVIGGGNIFGFLPSNAVITFSYTFSGLKNGALQANGNYSYINGNDFQGFYNSGTSTGTTFGGTVNGVASAPLVFSAANLNVVDPGISTGTTSFNNNGSSFSSFSSIFTGLLSLSPLGVGSATYAVSSIPLPAALPMFATLLAGMFGFGRSRKSKALAA